MPHPLHHLNTAAGSALARNRARRQYRRDEREYRRMVDSCGSGSAAREIATMWATRR
jgi:hypothetical protein